MNTIWKQWDEVKTLCRGKKIILFGHSEDWLHKTLPKLPHFADYIVDSNPAYTGTVFCGLKVYGPDKLMKDKKDKIYIIITAGPYESVSSQLESYGLKPGKHFCCSPAYYDFKLLQRFHSFKKKVLISSPDYDGKENHRHSRAGGGLFLYDTGSTSLKKVVPGHFRQFIQVDNYIYAVEYVEMQLYVLSNKFKTVQKFPIGSPGACGLAYCSKRKLLFLANCGTDVITAHDKKTFKIKDKIEFSDKYGKRKIGQHHINDICIVGDSLYVSCFSVSGNWKRGIFDGGIVEYDLDDLGKKPVVLMQNLWMPHSIKYLDTNLTYLDSMRGYLYCGNQIVSGKFPGLLRGLDYDGRFFYVGQSESMYMSRLSGISDNIMMNAGFYLFDIKTKASRFYPFMDMVNIHDILVMPGNK